MRALVDLTGKRFGRWLVLERAATCVATQRAHGQSRWLCRCDCGTSSVVDVGRLRCGRSKSCGCLRRELARKSHQKHGYARTGLKTVEYRAWLAMRVRCNNQNSKDYPRYGGRGISVCPRWDSFENFLADMGPRPKGMSLDRFPDKNGNYEPGNCRWATPKQQGRNSRSVKLNNDQVAEIRARLKEGLSGKAAAAKFGVSASNITMIKKGRTWAAEAPHRRYPRWEYPFDRREYLSLFPTPASTSPRYST